MSLYRQNRGRKGFVAVTVTVLILFAIDTVSGGMLRRVVRAPVSALSEWSVALSERIGATGFFSSRRALAAENKALRQEMVLLESRAAAYAAVKQENDELRRVLNVATHPHGITASVVSSTEASPYGTFWVGAGESDSVLYGSLVETAEGFIIGRITDVDTHRSLVTELFAPGASTPATLRGAPITIEGRGGGNGRTKVPRGMPLEVGDVVTSALFGGRPVAVVGSVETSAAEAFATVSIRLPVTVESLGFVYITSPKLP